MAKETKKAEEKKRYVVAPGCSFVGNKKTYNEGEEIDETAFKDKERFESFLKGDKPKIIPAPIGKEEEGKEEEKEAGKKREDLEKLALDGGLLKKEQLSAVKDDELEKILKDAGILK
jgi:hypothetical protein